MPKIRLMSFGSVFIGFIAAVAVAVSAWHSAIDQDAYQKRLETAQKNLEKAQDNIDKKTEEISLLNKRLMDFMTGGRSSAWALFYRSGVGGYFTFDVINDTDYPVYGLVAFVSVMSELSGRPGVFVGGPSKRWIIGDVSPRGIMPGNKKAFTLFPGRRNKISIIYIARNGRWKQDVYFVQKRGEWLVSSIAKHYDKDGGDIIHGYASDDFPKSLNW